MSEWKPCCIGLSLQDSYTRIEASIAFFPDTIVKKNGFKPSSALLNIQKNLSDWILERSTILQNIVSFPI